MRQTFGKLLTNKLVLVAALGYFVDIYDLVLFGMERVASLQDILAQVFPIKAYATNKWPLLAHNCSVYK